MYIVVIIMTSVMILLTCLCINLFVSVLNGCTRRGPFLANSLGIIALMYCSLDSMIEKARGEEDQFNSIAAAASAGMIFKSTGNT